MLETAGAEAGSADCRGGEGLGFPSRHRLHAAAEFSLVFAARRLLRGEYFDLHYLAARPGPRPLSEPQSALHSHPMSAIDMDVGARLGLVVAKKLARRSVQRNLLKRLAREAFRQAYAALPSYDLVLRLAKPPGKNLTVDARKAWRADVDRLLARLDQ